MTILYANVIPLLGICLAMPLEEILDAAELRPVRDCQAWKQS
jgi:hypothetical protein